MGAAAESFLSENTTEQEVEDFLENVCSLLPSEYASTCDEFVQDYLPEVIQYIMNNETPDVACQQIGLCSSTGIDIAAGELCQLCQFAVAAGESFLSENTTEEEVEDFIENLCNILPSEYASLCDDFVEEYLPEAINYILNNETPQVACSQLGLCRNAVDNHHHNSHHHDHHTEQVPQQGELCQICQFAVAAAESFLTENTTEEEIENFLENVCSLLPSEYGSMCDELVEQYLPEVIQYIMNNETPDVACQQVCLFVIGAGETLDRNGNLDPKEILAGVTKGCQLLPSKYQSTCLFFIRTYAQDMLSAIKSQQDPTE